MTTKLNASIFGNLFYLVGGHFQTNYALFSKYHEKFVLDNTHFTGEFTYKKTNIHTGDVKLHQIQSDIIIKHIHSRVWFMERYVIKSDNNIIIEKHNIKTIWHYPCTENIQYICNTEYKDLPKELLEVCNGKSKSSVKNTHSVRFSN